MRWWIIRIIWTRELRDQLRDRRTLFMIAGLPLLLYPILGVAVLQFAAGFVERPSVIGIVNGAGQPQEFPPRQMPAHVSMVPSAVSLLALSPTLAGGLPVDRLAGAAALAEASRNAGATNGLSPLPPIAWLACHSLTLGPIGVDQMAGAAALSQFSHACNDYPLLLSDGKFSPHYYQVPKDIFGTPGVSKLQIIWLDSNQRDVLTNKKVDVLLSVSPAFWGSLDKGKPSITVEYRDSDDNSRLANQRLQTVLAKWKKHIKEVRFSRHQLPTQFDEPFLIREPDADVAASDARSAIEMLLRIFPFMLVMWSLAEALYPAVDLCAGEKERGTMETLLISPASREEVVWGKFLTIWIFSAGTALLNVFSMAVTTWWFASLLPRLEVTPSGMFWSVLLLLPLSAFFSAVCLAIGAYARSTKEGQYYLMPLFLLTMPLTFLTLAPGVELNSFYSMVPVTGVALLMQRLLVLPPLEQPWFYIISVMAPILIYGWLALRWAIDQFQREEVLFREAERFEIHLWLRSLYRDRQEWPSIGQALCCFAMLLGLRWLSLGLGLELNPLPRNLIILAAFVAAPPLFMGLLLTCRPRQILSARWPAWTYLAAGILLVPLVELAVTLMYRFPRLGPLLIDRQVLADQAFAGYADSPMLWSSCIIGLAFLTAAAKEIAFRGFIMAGLLSRMEVWPAILASSFLYAAFHMNVLLLPALFLLGIVLGLLAWRSGSLLPGTVLYGICYSLLLGGPRWFGATWASDGIDLTAICAVAVVSSVVAIALLWRTNLLAKRPLANQVRVTNR